MTSQKFAAVDILGLTPGVDPTQSSKVFVINGKNFIFDSIGPKSAFGDRFLQPVSLSKFTHTQGIRVNVRTKRRCLTLTNRALLEWSERKGGFEVLYQLDDTSLIPFRWTFGYLAGFIYLCHPAIGILVIDADTGLVRRHESIGIATPEAPIALVVNNGRLCVVTPTVFAWSEASNGLSFEPSLGGGGFQVLSDRVSGDVITITSDSTGTLTWTNGGVMRSEFTADAYVYRHRSLNTDYRPANSFCTVRIDDDTTVILDQRGLFASRKDNLQPFAPLFNEFLIQYIRTYNLDVGQNMRLEWDELNRILYLSFSHSYANPIYERAFAYYPALDRWGSFDQLHYGIIPILIEGSPREDEYYGFVDSDGAVRYWDQKLHSREKPVKDSALVNANLFEPVIQQRVQLIQDDTGCTMPSVARVYGFPRENVNGRTGYYLNQAYMPLLPQTNPLDALIQLGLFRPVDEQASDQMAEIVNILIRNVESMADSFDVVDFNALSGSEDFNTETGGEDYGTNLINYVTHKLRVISTVDGLSEYDSTTPELVSYHKGARYYSCAILGVWHLIEIAADAVGESFHIRTCELTAVNGGRYL